MRELEKRAIGYPIWAYGNVEGDWQTDGRAELTAAIELPRATQGKLVVHLCYKPRVDGFPRGAPHVLGGNLGSLWHELWEIARGREGGIALLEFRKIHAHRAVEHA